MAGMFLTFVVEFTAHRLAGGHGHGHDAVDAASPAQSESKDDIPNSERAAIAGSSGRSLIINTAIIEAGIIFHSISKSLNTPRGSAQS